MQLNLAEVLNESPQDFKDSLQRSLVALAAEHETKIEVPSAQEGLKNLVKALAEKERVVVLVDEYDKPIIDNLDRPEVTADNRKLLQNLFGALKNLEDYLRFTFVTCISKFAQVSLFSGANNLKDITLSPKYAGMMGYTEQELVAYFDEHLQAITQARSTPGQPLTQEAVLAEIKAWYNGYRFSEEEIYVYNPFSTLNYLDEQKPKSYWYASGTPSFLLEQVKKHPNSVVPLSGVKAEESELMSMGSLAEIDLKALMFQTGYLTIVGYSALSQHYQLGFPNQEVREAFTKSLVKQFAPIDTALSSKLEAALEQHDLTLFFEQIQAIFASFPYQMFIKVQESTYHGFLLSLLSGMGLEVAAESLRSLGRVDLLVQLPMTTYVIELKLDSSPETALAQIREKQYYMPHLRQGKKVGLVGLIFSSKTRNVAAWIGELLDEQGALIQKLLPQVKQAESDQTDQEDP